MKEIKTMEFRGPLAELIMELEIEATEWCERNCPEVKGFFAQLLNPLGRLPCFDNPVYHLDLIEKCPKLPKLYKFYWKAKGKDFNGVWPVIIYKEEE